MSVDPSVMDRLRRRYFDSLPDKLTTLESLRARLEVGDEAALESLQAFAHRIGGTGGSYGWLKISEAGTRLELADDSQRTDALEGLVDAIQAAIASGRP